MQKFTFKIMILAICSLNLPMGTNAQNEARLMRYPDINKNLIELKSIGFVTN